MPQWITDPIVETTFTAADISNYEKIDWALQLSNIPEAWKETEGDGIKIAIIDADCVDHPDINNNIVVQQSFTDDAKTVNQNGHGVFVAGIIGASKDGRGIIGGVPKAKLIMLKALSNSGSGREEWIAAAIAEAVRLGADVINMSLGAPVDCPKIYEEIQKAYRRGIPCICAAGNDGHFEFGTNVNYPARYRETIAVASVDKEQKLSDYSCAGDEVDLAAGGERVYSCYVRDGIPCWAILSGTSFSGPVVTVVAALCISKHRKVGGETPIKTVEEIRKHVCRTATDVGPEGRDRYFGNGIVDAEKAIFYKKEEDNGKENQVKKPDVISKFFRGLWRMICGLFDQKETLTK